MPVRTRTIRTERLVLRQFSEEDAPVAYDNWMSDPDVTEFLTWSPHRSSYESCRIVRSWIRSYPQGSMDWCITVLPGPEPVGSITAVQDHPDEGYCELGFCIAKKHWNKGLMTEALRAVAEYIFVNTDYMWIQTRYDKENEASGRCQEKAGFKSVGEVLLPNPKDADAMRTYVMMRVDRPKTLR
ncbi:MAG: GNAT family N-acetyltransferase [Candidatus Methanoplasma sp.]|jgi:RimJ/RimL family protein N-acetyltransferase|nr:GNAT family N-acetyltransferase [Candidatus Methanoplasma sp.]